MSYKAIKIDLTEKQAMAALKGMAVRISASQIGKGTTFVSLHPENAKKVERAFMQKKGTTLHLSHGELADTAQRMSGSGFWGNIWKGIKSVWRVAKDSGLLTAAADAAVAPLSALTGQPALVMGARKIAKDVGGFGVGQQAEPPRRMLKADKFAMLKGAGIYLS